jgi:hypothetical protein
MNYCVKALKIVHINERTTLEDYEQYMPNSIEAIKEELRLKSIGGYCHIRTEKITKGASK